MVSWFPESPLQVQMAGARPAEPVRLASRQAGSGPSGQPAAICLLGAFKHRLLPNADSKSGWKAPVTS